MNLFLLDDDSPCPVKGQYLDEKMVNIPAEYLLWLYNQSWLPKKYPNVRYYIEENLEALQSELINQ